MHTYDLHAAARNGTLENLSASLLTREAFLKKDDTGNTALHSAAWSGYLADVPDMILNDRELWLVQNSFGRTALHWAVENGHTTAVPEIILNDRDLWIVQGIDGDTPLHWAVVHGHLAAVPECIRRSFADDTNLSIKLRQNLRESLTIEPEACSPSNSAFTSSSLLIPKLHAPACAGTLRDLPDSVLTREMFAQQDANGLTALHWAVAGGHLEQVPKAICNDRDLWLTPDKDGRTALHLVASMGDLDQVPEFIRNDRAAMSCFDLLCCTPIEDAADSGHLDQVPKSLRQDFITNPCGLNSRLVEQLKESLEAKNDHALPALNDGVHTKKSLG